MAKLGQRDAIARIILRESIPQTVSVAHDLFTPAITALKFAGQDVARRNADVMPTRCRSPVIAILDDP